ncbi:hypothetical protein NPIL_22491 [Nephila pilipes]|uniref:Secreted protein n=1 Tax=Nephila pilipes TaxID=299642 RepID=A0A8X6NQ68_NEPPI|nr:hypothetical protein NPIL_22491 [Nephila pilipes]
MLDIRYVVVSFVTLLCVMVDTAEGQEITLEENVAMDTARCVATSEQVPSIQSHRSGERKDVPAKVRGELGFLLAVA